MLNLLTQATKKTELEIFCDVKIEFHYTKKFQLHPGDSLIYFDVGLNKGTWNRQQTTIDIHRSIKTQPFNKLLRSKRVLVPINCFFGKKDKQVYLIKLAKERTFYIGTLSNKGSLTVLSVPAPKILSKQIDDLPVIIHKDHAQAWLNTTDMMDVFDMAGNSDLNWFDMYPVDESVCYANSNNPNLLKAIGPSLMDAYASNDELLERTLEQNRTRRGK